MPKALEEVSTITAKGQTTVPKAVRQALGVEYGDRIVFRIGRDGVTVRRADRAETDPAISEFLAFLARDLTLRPEAIQGFALDLAAWIAALTADVPVDLDALIDGEVDL